MKKYFKLILKLILFYFIISLNELTDFLGAPSCIRSPFKYLIEIQSSYIYKIYFLPATKLSLLKYLLITFLQ